MTNQFERNNSPIMDYYQSHTFMWLWAVISLFQVTLIYYVIDDNQFFHPAYLGTLACYAIGTAYLTPQILTKKILSRNGVYGVVFISTLNWLMMTHAITIMWGEYIAAERLILIAFFSSIICFSSSKFLSIVSTLPLIATHIFYHAYYEHMSGMDLVISVIKFPILIIAIVLTMGKHTNRLIDSHKQLIELNGELTKLKNTDPLTELNNRRAFDERLDFMLNLHNRDGQPLSLIILDIDYFKKYNDSLGHPQGDVCLKQVSDVLKNSVKRSTDTVARIGGEEFAIILPFTSLEQSKKVAQHVMNNMKSAGIAHPQSPIASVITVSAGCASVVDGASTAESLYKRADSALYRAKESGRARYSV